MLIFILKRFLYMILTLFFVLVMIFIIIELPPGDYADRYAFRKLTSSGVSVTESDMEHLADYGHGAGRNLYHLQPGYPDRHLFRLKPPLAGDYLATFVGYIGLALPNFMLALVLSLPDAGELLLKALLDQDMFLGGAILLIISTMIVIGVFFSDLLLAALNPRIRLGVSQRSTTCGDEDT